MLGGSILFECISCSEQTHDWYIKKSLLKMLTKIWYSLVHENSVSVFLLCH